jgi:3-hydroxyisobutyrate dehydrogenase
VLHLKLEPKLCQYLKVMTNYLATANLLTLCEALVTMKAVGLDLATTYEAIKISSGTSFVHETKS